MLKYVFAALLIAFSLPASAQQMGFGPGCGQAPSFICLDPIPLGRTGAINVNKLSMTAPSAGTVMVTFTSTLSCGNGVVEGYMQIMDVKGEPRTGDNGGVRLFKGVQTVESSPVNLIAYFNVDRGRHTFYARGAFRSERVACSLYGGQMGWTFVAN